MGIEIERKFLLANNDWRLIANDGKTIQQGFLNSNKERTVRIRIFENKGIITIKSNRVNNVCKEFEYEIPIADALELIELCEKPIIKKTRFEIVINGNTWEIDAFEGENKGLIVAEIELEDENQTFEIPKWIGKEVSNDARYFNSNLVKHPFTKW